MTNYNLTNLTNAQNVGDLVTFANSSTEGFFIGLVMVAIFFILLMALKKWEFTNALLASSWVSFLLAAILAYGGYVNVLLPLGFLILAATTALYLWTVGNSA
jgi:hypothetical protein